mgnify:CR=1 FL=1
MVATPPMRRKRSILEPAWPPGRAFTLVELLCVMIILALMAGMAVPRYASFLAVERAEAAVRRITADLALAQRRSAFTSTSRTVTFDVAANAYQLVGMDDPSHPGKPYVVYLGEEPYGATLVSADLGGDANLTFTGYGDPDSGGTIVIKVGDRTKTITIDPQAGIRRVLEYVLVTG